VPQFFDEQASDSQYGTGSVASTCSTRDYKDATDLVVQPVTQLPIGLDEEQNAVVDGFGTLKARMLGGGFEGTVAVCATGHRTHTLKAEGFDGSEDGTGRGTPIVPAIAFHPTQDPISSIEVTHALGTGSKGGCATAAVAIPIISDADRAESSAQTPSPDAEGRVRLRDPGLGIGQDGDPMFTLQATKPHAVAFAQNTRDEVRLVGGDGQTVGALAAQPGMKQTTYLATIEVTGTLSSRATAGGGLGTDFEVAGGLRPEGPMACRRLLPIETERLQGFPDDWTNIPWRGKPAPDGPRYKAMGNSMAVPVMRWIGERLDRVAKGEA
jgi:DNA (cytosine-5)-methyltransferase 1